MSAPKTAWRLRLEELLADGEWHDLDECCAVAGPMIPPGRAARVTEAERRRWSDGPRQRPLSADAAAESGRRRVVRWTLHQMVRSGAAVATTNPTRWKQPNRG